MKTMGLIGGLSWFSTTVYYRIINQLTNERLGGSHSAKLFLYSVDFNDFRVIQDKGDWKGLENMLAEIAHRLENAGADCIVMCTNTPHIVADELRERINVPLLHIAEETAKEIVKQNIKTVALLGTRFTMENSFFKNRLANYGLETIIPGSEDRDFIHNSIFNELTKGIFDEQTKARYIRMIEELGKAGAQGVIFGCTEISLLINQADCKIRVFDTTAIHAKAAVDFALAP
ncbi:MAG TPA: aspartate/glutamate racemase family protein [Cyclobacteriaceae bacterium]|nr:aspartate/glutamate racemase family protein [Cyclobacteriaceae bacterium]